MESITMSNLLGIYIPTKDRPVELEECLRSIIKQVKRFRLPIYISDNSSEKETMMLVESLKKEYNRIFYEKNMLTCKSILSQNTYSSNILNVLKMGKTEFVWFFGDDDILEEGAIETILDELMAGSKFLLVCSLPYSKDLKISYQEQIFPKADKDIIYKKGQHNLALKKANISYLAGAIVDKKRLDKAIKDNLLITDSEIFSMKTGRRAEPRFTHYFCYLAIVGLEGKLIAKPLVGYRKGNNTKEKESYLKVALTYKEEAIDTLKGPFSLEVCDSLMQFDLNSLAPMVMTAKIMQPQMTEKNKQIIWNDKHLNTRMRYLLTSLLLIPTPIYKIVQRTRYIIKGKDW